MNTSPTTAESTIAMGTPGAGHNNPPKSQEDELNEALAERHREAAERKAELLSGAATITTIRDEDEEKRITDFGAQLSSFLKVQEAQRESEKNPFLVGGRVVDGFFRALTDPIDAERKRLKRLLTEFKLAREEAERKERLRKEQEARREAERLEREAREKREAAERAAREEEERAQRAREAAQRKERERQEAEERERQAERDRVAAEERAKAARRAALEAEENERKEAQERAEREAKAAEDARERERRAEEERLQREADERQAARDAEEAEALAEDTKSAADDVIEEIETVDSEAIKQAKAEANKAGTATRAKASKLTGSRGDYGGHSSLTTRWTHGEVDRDKLDLESLRQHINMNALEVAVRAYIKAGGRKLDGVLIYEEKSTALR